MNTGNEFAHRFTFIKIKVAWFAIAIYSMPRYFYQLKNQINNSSLISICISMRAEICWRDTNTKSYASLIAQMFILGRGWSDAQISGIEMDGKNFDEILPLVEEAKRTGQWLVLAGHEMGNSGVQTTRLAMLKQLIEYVQDPANRIWIAPAGTVAGQLGK